ncbi:MAG: hypothetical protein ACRD8O_22545, partial [Bryobacteraceae bacterium]
MRLALVAVIMLVAACSRPASNSSPAEAIETGRILQFYAAPGVIAKGESASLCYGTENVRAVRIEPEVEKLNPSLSRCFPVSPSSNTEYTLFVTGNDGTGLRQTIRVTVTAAQTPAPKITAFTAMTTSIPPGSAVTVCFSANDADTMHLDPPVQELGQAIRGCFAVRPPQTTTYTLTAEAAGHPPDRKKLTITVK